MGELLATSETVEALRAEVARLRRDVDALKARPVPEPQVLDADGAARFLGCSRRTVERLVQAARIPCARVFETRGLRFLRSDLTAWLRRGCTPPGASRLDSRRDRRPAASPRALPRMSLAEKGRVVQS